jgi:hypothetical protein
MDDAELTPAERAELDRVDSMLADPALWTEPPTELQEQVVAAIAQERDRDGRRRWTRYAVGAVAASVVLALGATAVVKANQDHPTRFTAAMAGTPLASKADGEVTLTKTRSGWRIEVHADGLPRRDGDRFYEAWLKNDDGLLVSIGTFNDGHAVTLWSGVSPADFTTLTVTQEFLDGDPASSGMVVLVGRPERS